ncbi:LacI family DNA-binding transcriptional regulator [Paenibacillus donghaensis]|uniref:LacI family DNA-binding transcriptional regulator n=1 Tax=Paenibacillus donghaensis TaxID=414771 RepID=UPI0018838722|nr:LacI family DNA-binding transcriptional regulator [Paenibacillus donghaensis]MBE9918082.1 LacI family DNA-binding transcriptional regulator [Paenibacillus donghaensis]
MANIKDIARIAGVSVTTVSRVMNNHPYVREDKRKAVMQAMKQANYHRNINAVHLSTGKTNLIGVVVPFINLPYFGTVIDGIAGEAVKDNYKLVMIQTNYEEQREIEALEMLKDKQVAALIICSKMSSWEVVEAYASFGPIAVLEDGRGRKLSSTYINHYQCFTDALHYLHQKGHRKIGYCMSRKNGTSSRQREAAYRDFMKSINEPVNENYIFYKCLHFEDGEIIMQRMSQMDNPPTALLVTGDQLAAGILICCKERGISVPGDLAIVGFDNQPIAKVLNITTFELPLAEIGRKLYYQAVQNKHFHQEIPAIFIERLTV